MRNTIKTMSLALLFAYLGVEGGFYEKYIGFGYNQAESSVVLTPPAVPTTQTKERKEQWCDRFLSDPTPVKIKVGNPIEVIQGVRGVPELNPDTLDEKWKFDCRLREFLVRQFKAMPDSKSRSFNLRTTFVNDTFFAPLPGWDPWGETPSRYSERTRSRVGPEAYRAEKILVMSPSYCLKGLLDDTLWVGDIRILYTCSYFYLRVSGFGSETFIIVPPGDLPQMSLERWEAIFKITHHNITE